MLQAVELASIKPNSIDAVHLITEASRLAYADRNHYIGDPDFLDIPVGRLIDPEYLIGRFKLIKIDQSIGKAASGELDQNLTKKFAPDESLKGKSTSHLTVVDKSGNVVSMTTTIENPFGSHLMVRGFLLNNQLTDFSFNPIKDGKFVANSVWPGKRPRSSMAPTIIFDNAGKPVFALGSPGGSRIIGYVTKSIIAVLDWKMNIQSAFELPNFVNLNSYTDIQYKYYFEHNKPFPNDFTTQAHAWYYRKFPQTKVNKMIPIGKHYERCQERKRAAMPWVSVEEGTHFSDKIIPNLYKLEKNSLEINDKFDEHFKLKNKKHSIKDNNIYGWYNPYTTTGRPVNNFNGINFVGLKHGTGERDCFVPKNDYFIEMDYDSYHPYLIAKMVDYDF